LRSDTAVIIPARLASSRLPNKPLIEFGGETVIGRVFDRCLEADVGYVYVATPDLEVAIITQDETGCHCGSDAVARYAEKLQAKYIINVQGDMPFIDPAHIRMVAEKRWESEADIVTATVSLDYVAFYQGKDRTTVHRDRVHQHVGIYAFTAESLKRFAALGPSKYEIESKLELLRATDHGMTVEVVELPYAPLEINTPEDVERIRAITG
jgi:3-deoxy-manno-octulosonate cytidylyltransferase (CMP-KDO synthetase)